MSSLNINNIDVQRVINVLTELKRKMYLLSFFNFQTLEKEMSNEDDLAIRINSKETFDEIKKQWDLMNQFKSQHINQEQENSTDKQSDNKNEEEDPDIEQKKEDEKTKIKEKENLLDIEENTSEVTKNLAKSTRNLARLLYKNTSFIEAIKGLRGNLVINKFCEDFLDLVDNYIKQVKMTLEEEKSDNKLNLELKKKIEDLKMEKVIKEAKLKKLVADRAKFKNDCKSQLEEIDKERENIINFTDSQLKEKEEKIDEYLLKREEDIKNNEKGSKSAHEAAILEFQAKRKENDDAENRAMNDLITAENSLKSLVNEYDTNQTEIKTSIEELKEKNEEKRIENDALAAKRNKLKEKSSYYENSFKKYVEKKDNEEMLRMQLLAASQFCQAHFRGFVTRKQLKKKYKFLYIFVI